MTGSDNPYRDALVGLDLPDPVQAFFDFCREREATRSRRVAGQPWPWSDDPIFQRGRFLNVFREDDKGTIAVMCFAEPARESVPDLIQALFFARWCNRHTTLDMLHPDELRDPAGLRCKLLEGVSQPWASEVYPVVALDWEGCAYQRLEASLDVFPRARGFLEDCIRKAGGSVIAATEAINARFQMSNDFPIFMALVDLALFRPDLISPDSPVPTGIGAAPFLDLLQAQLGCATHQAAAECMIALQPRCWPEAKRRFTPIDVEYLACECRKYYSYVNGTKKFEGRNLFVPAT
jgi:hypothetical protein